MAWLTSSCLGTFAWRFGRFNKFIFSQSTLNIIEVSLHPYIRIWSFQSICISFDSEEKHEEIIHIYKLGHIICINSSMALNIQLEIFAKYIEYMKYTQNLKPHVTFCWECLNILSLGNFCVLLNNELWKNM